MKLSVVTTLYRSERFVKEFYERVSVVVKEITDDYELIFVNDGSPDNSNLKVLQARELDDHVKLIELSRNFGHHKAVMTGLRYASGDLIYLLDIDLEEPPELLRVFHDNMVDKKVDVVYGVQEKRKGKYFEKITGKFFYTMFNLMSEIPIEENILMARLMNKEYVESLKKYNEKELFLGGVFAMVGYNQISIPVAKGSRPDTTYTFKKKMSLLVNAITATSNRLLIYVFYLGLIVSVASFAGLVYFTIRAIFYDDYLEGWPSLIVSIWFLSGLIIISIGILGIYLSKIFNEVKQRPLTVISKIYD
ncbi:glycosyltransferase family 2 protein [Aquimarina litoralis]|uniref:glycosyltransferase family 2 protein n=1 Tax=Aquimarina litoralis TaxID=584605 RepID=UPI001C585284|nr:glycosyltransferase family 2 protein [Aquimarina litoralis]MBW1297148.1 glycosyltransferase [Aquimarina litoralis]